MILFHFHVVNLIIFDVVFIINMFQLNGTCFHFISESDFIVIIAFGNVLHKITVANSFGCTFKKILSLISFSMKIFKQLKVDEFNNITFSKFFSWNKNYLIK
jgi:hypothetical protein